MQFQKIDVLTDGQGLELRWTASDKNFGNGPISLFYRTEKNGPWQPIARGVKNDGHYCWAVPKNGESQFFFKIEAADLVGNVSHAETPTAVLYDVTEPRGVVIRVIPRGTPQGN